MDIAAILSAIFALVTGKSNDSDIKLWIGNVQNGVHSTQGPSAAASLNIYDD